MKKNWLILLALGGAVAYFVWKKGGGSSAPTVGKNGTTAPHDATKVPGPAATTKSGISTGDIANYTKSFNSLTSGLSGLWDNFNGSSASDPGMANGYSTVDLNSPDPNSMFFDPSLAEAP